MTLGIGLVGLWMGNCCRKEGGLPARGANRARGPRRRGPFICPRRRRGRLRGCQTGWGFRTLAQSSASCTSCTKDHATCKLNTGKQSPSPRRPSTGMPHSFTIPQNAVILLLRLPTALQRMAYPTNGVEAVEHKLALRSENARSLPERYSQEDAPRVPAVPGGPVNAGRRSLPGVEALLHSYSAAPPL